MRWEPQTPGDDSAPATGPDRTSRPPRSIVTPARVGHDRFAPAGGSGPDLSPRGCPLLSPFRVIAVIVLILAICIGAILIYGAAQ